MNQNASKGNLLGRGDRLYRLLESFINGKRTTRSADDSKLLLEAICSQEDHAGCIERIGCSQHALQAIRQGVRFDNSDVFINGHLADFLAYLAAPAVKLLCNGEFLRRVLAEIVRPPTLWNALVAAHEEKRLMQRSQSNFAWLLLELLLWNDEPPIDVDALASKYTRGKDFLQSEDREVRALGYRIQHIVQAKQSDHHVHEAGPGGRHDNDFADFRKIAIYPTGDELSSTDRPYYSPAQALADQPWDSRAGFHLENQFRLLREDFLADIRDDLETSSKKGKGGFRRQRTRLRGLEIAGAYCGQDKFKVPFSLAVSVGSGLDFLTAKDVNERRKYLKDFPGVLKNNSFGYFIDDGRVVAFAKLVRVEELLTRKTPIVTLQVPGNRALKKVLVSLKTSRTVEFVLIETAAFAYEPVLRCLQSKVELPLWEQLLATKANGSEGSLQNSTLPVTDLSDEIEHHGGGDLRSVMSLPKSVRLDESQTSSLLAGLRQSVSLIQGPPGTGKSFIGALLGKALHDHTKENILVLCFTNHALDQFLEDLLNIGIPSQSMVRLGSKSTLRTKHLGVREQAPAGSRTQQNWDTIKRLNDETQCQEGTLKDTVTQYSRLTDSRNEIMDYLEFSDDDYEYFEAFQVPKNDEGFIVVGEAGRHVDESYLLDRWIRGLDAGVFSNSVSPWHVDIWEMDIKARFETLKRWTREILEEAAGKVIDGVNAFNASQSTLHEAWSQKDTEVVQKKRIVACTTTFAAMYSKQLQTAAPGIVLVEEAGEILESHILTAMTPSTKQLILIGDHKQLRPKVTNYNLTVEKGDGYDLNRSMFERLALSGFPHTVLKRQHRMCPEISSFVRALTYPDLLDADSTTSREPLRGIRSRVIFIKHEKQELASVMADRRDQGATASKQNEFEAHLTLSVVKYLAQQGYGASDQVVLTPYLGQLNLLRRELAKDNDPVLNDLDTFDLVKAGVMSPANAAQNKRRIHLSTIDNYQGEESDIVIVNLTRSNPNGDIGFMASPERLNVMLSRARKALIMIGNPVTFRSSRKGGELWNSFFDLLAKSNSIFDGLPVRCERHKDREMVLSQPSDFELYCPDGGCSAPCGAQLACGVHQCPQKCHRRTDHSKMKCAELIRDKCSKGHILTRKCSDGHPASCLICDAEIRVKAERQARDLKLEQARQEKQRMYSQQLAELQDEIDQLRRLAKDKREREDQEHQINQYRKDLEAAKVQAAKREAAIRAAANTRRDSAQAATRSQNDNLQTKGGATQQTGDVEVEHSPLPESDARDDWEAQKASEGCQNEALDELMEMIGLEGVKEQFLEIKSKIDLAIRQELDPGKERFGASLLGNPGTGKTTVARLYAKFLTSVGALPGDHFVETTGAKLANEGVKGCEKILETIKNAGGGALFIDEAYQLTSGAHVGGPAVLDFLLAEVENLTGKVVFILAGYNNHMEKFFAHNPGLPSRFPRQFQFADYQDHELLEILQFNVSKKYEGRMKVEDGPRGLYARILAKRLGRGRGKEGFGNARAVENAVGKVASRQAQRVRKQRKARKSPDDMLFTKEDLIGPMPTDVLSRNHSWIKLQKMIGLGSVKESVKALLDSLQFNYQRELHEEPIVDFSLNKVFLGSPGTGKTTVAKLYGQILADIGMLSNGEVVVKKPADFVGGVLGASEANTKGILDAAIGKVLVLDEAYGLYGGAQSKGSDPYRTAVIDTIVAEVQNVPGDDRCVLLLGYKEQMEEMMNNSNPGLARRFPIDSGFHFQDFTDDEMALILDMKLKEQHFSATDAARTAALEVLRRARNRPHFGNAGEVDILLNDAKMRQQKRISKDASASRAIFEAQDFDPDFDRAERAVTNIEVLFRDTVGCENVVAQLQSYQTTVANMRKMDMDPREQIPFAFLFRGPPGTGKTTTAKRMGKVYYDMGFLASAEVVSCSASDLTGEYVGQTGPKTRKLLESALGKVLFIDEAYRLGAGLFAQEAMDELVDCMTNDRFFRKLIIILAGYDADINRLMSTNPGLTSRFPEAMVFTPLRPNECFDLLQKELRKKKCLDTSILDEPQASFRTNILAKFELLAEFDNFANARDIQTLAKDIFGSLVKNSAISKGQQIHVDEKHIMEAIGRMIDERLKRSLDAVNAIPRDQNKINCAPPQVRRQEQQNQSTSMSQGIVTAAETKVEQTSSQREDTEDAAESHEGDDGGSDQPTMEVQRDAGVSDAIWNQLQLDKAREEEAEREFQRLQEEERRLKEWLKACADAKRQKDLEELERKRKALEEQRRREAKVKEQLKRMGRCPVGYEWIKEQGGYRCAGGSHWMHDSQVSAMLQ